MTSKTTPKMTSDNNTFDVVISGGGLSGTLMALSLADLTKPDGSLLSIAVVEATTVDVSNASVTANNKPNTLFDDRVLALSHGSATYLEKIGVWQHLSNKACAIEKIDISDRGHYGKARLEANEQGVLALGYVIEMAVIGQAQLTELVNKHNVQWFNPDQIVDINWQTNQTAPAHVSTVQHSAVQHSTVEITLESGRSLNAHLLLGCDGVNSPCRQLAGIKAQHSDYQQVALIANVATKKPHLNKAYERFTEFGPLAMLPLSTLKGDPKGENRCSLVWTMSPSQSEELMALNNEEFSQQLELAFGSWLGAITHIGKRDVYPLVLVQAEQQTYHRMALIGNASHTIHPIAGQGFNLGLRDVQEMSNLIRGALAQGNDFASFALLNEYGLKRQQDQKQIINLTDALVTLFANDLIPLVAGRNIGLKVMNYVTPIKNTLVNKLMGY